MNNRLTKVEKRLLADYEATVEDLFNQVERLIGSDDFDFWLAVLAGHLSKETAGFAEIESRILADDQAGRLWAYIERTDPIIARMVGA